MSPIIPDPKEERRRRANELGKAIGSLLGVATIYCAILLAVLLIVGLIGYILYRCIHG